MASPRTAGAGQYRIGEPQLQQGCSGLECTIGEIIASDVFLVSAIVAAAIALVALTYLTSARKQCTEERDRVKAETEAFERFVRGVKGLQTASVQPNVVSDGGGMLAQAKTTGRSSQLADVYDLYENTVMAVPHYDADYGEPLKENMAIELGEDVTTALDTGTRFTPQIKRALIQKGIDTKTSREAFLETLDTEAASLAETHDALADIDCRVRRIDDRQRLQQSFDELEHHWNELDAMEDECADVLERRQEQVRTGIPASHWRGDGHGLCAYLYESLPVTYPALAEGTLLYDRIKTAKRKFTESLTRRV